MLKWIKKGSQRDTLSCKGQLEKLEVGNFYVEKFEMKLARMKLKSSGPTSVTVFQIHFNSTTSVRNFSKISETFQHR